MTNPGRATVREKGNKEKKEGWLANNWLLAIVGGTLATLLGTYAYTAISHAFGAGHPARLPSSVKPIHIQVYPDHISARQGSAVVGVFVSGLTPRGTVDADLDEPGGGSYFVESTMADTQGNLTFDPKWSPTYSDGGSTPLGDYRIVIRDRTSGATATANLLVLR